MTKEKEQLGRRQTLKTRKKLSKASTGKKNSQWKDGRRSYRRIVGAKKGEHVHHKNNDSKDNRPINLEKFPEKGPGRAKHEKSHHRENNFKKYGGRKKVKRGYVARVKSKGNLKNQKLKKK